MIFILKVELANVGQLHKLRIRHDNTKSFPDWHLEKVLYFGANKHIILCPVKSFVHGLPCWSWLPSFILIHKKLRSRQVTKLNLYQEHLHLD